MHMNRDFIGDHLIQAINQAFPDGLLGGDVATEIIRSGFVIRSDNRGPVWTDKEGKNDLWEKKKNPASIPKTLIIKTYKKSANLPCGIRQLIENTIVY